MKNGSKVLLTSLFLFFSLNLLSEAQVRVKEEQDRLLARVGKESIKVDDMEEILRQSFPMSLILYKGEQGKKNLLRELVDQELFAQEARKEGLDKRPDIQKKIAYAINRILYGAYLEQALSDVKAPSEGDLENYYVKNQQAFMKAERIKVRGILFKNEREANEALKLLKKGEDLSGIGGERDRCTEATMAGEPGWIERGSGPPAIEEAAFSLAEGQVSEVIRTDQGYCVLRVQERQVQKPALFFEVKDKIKQQMLNEQREGVLAKLREQLEKTYRVEIYPERVTLVPEETSRMTDEEFLKKMQQKSLWK